MGKIWRNSCVGESLWKTGRWGRRLSSESEDGRTLEVGEGLERGALWVQLVSFPDPQYMRKEGLVNLVQNFEHHGISAVEI